MGQKDHNESGSQTVFYRSQQTIKYLLHEFLNPIHSETHAEKLMQQREEPNNDHSRSNPFNGRNINTVRIHPMLSDHLKKSSAL